MDLASIFKPRTAASSRFRPFYGEAGGFPWGYSKEGTYGPGIERQPIKPGEYALMSDIVGDLQEEDIIDKPQEDVTAGAPEFEPIEFGHFGGGEWDEDFDFDDSTFLNFDKREGGINAHNSSPVDEENA